MKVPRKKNLPEALDEMFRDEAISKLIDDIMEEYEKKANDATALPDLPAPEEEPHREARPVTFDEFGQEEVNEIDYARGCGYYVDDDGHWVPYPDDSWL